MRQQAPDSEKAKQERIRREEPYRDAGGRACLLIGDTLYYLNPITGDLYRSIDREWTDKNGRTWKTPERKKIKNRRIQAQLEAAS